MLWMQERQEKLEEEDRGTAKWKRGTATTALGVRETGETGRGGKRDSDMET